MDPTPTRSLPEQHVAAWRVLVVDDDLDTLDVTSFALEGLRVENQPVELTEAKTASDALERFEPGRFALVIADVVMERRDAGLRLVEEIRRRDCVVRIVVRTGQPGDALEREVTQRFDINDYWTKGTMTAARLQTAVAGLVRSYRDLRALDRSRRLLETTVGALQVFAARRSPDELVKALFNAASSVLSRDLTAVLVASMEDCSGDSFSVLASLGDAPDDGGRAVRLSDRHRALLGRACVMNGLVVDGDLAAVAIEGKSRPHLAAVFEGWIQLDDERAEIGALLACNTLRTFDQIESEAIERDRLEQSVRTDEMLDLPNRRALVEALHQHADTLESGSLVVFDIDELKAINLAFGVEAGDEVIRALGAQLSEQTCCRCHIARVDGDEIAALIPSPSSEATVAFIQRAFDGVRARLSTDGHGVPASFKAGFTRVRGTDPSAALRLAYAALDEARRSRTPWAECDEELLSRITRQAELENIMRARDEVLANIRLVYQPIVRLDDEAWVGVEALLRWSTPSLGSVRPDIVIDMANRTGIIHELGAAIIERAASEIGQLTCTPMYVSINVSTTQLASPLILSAIDRGLASLSCHQMMIEMTEQVAMVQDDRTRCRLRAIRDRGVGVFLDDFGTGHSSLAYLLDDAWDTLKLDRTFISRLPEDQRSARLVRALHAIAETIDCSVVAEGVETSEQAEWLRQMGVPYAQGYWFARPLEFDALRLAISEGRHRGVGAVESAS